MLCEMFRYPSLALGVSLEEWFWTSKLSGVSQDKADTVDWPGTAGCSSSRLVGMAGWWLAENAANYFLLFSPLNLLKSKSGHQRQQLLCYMKPTAATIARHTHATRVFGPLPNLSNHHMYSLVLSLCCPLSSWCQKQEYIWRQNALFDKALLSMLVILLITVAAHQHVKPGSLNTCFQLNKSSPRERKWSIANC